MAPPKRSSTGDDDREKWTAQQCAEYRGIKDTTWWSYVSREYAPPPDGREKLSNKPYWYPETVKSHDYRPTKPRAGGRRNGDRPSRPKATAK